MRSFKTVFYRIEDSRLAGCERGLRIVQISDLHNADFGADGSALKNAIDALKPDVVLSSGDLITAKGGRLHMDRALQTAAAISKAYPFYYADGNHELRMQADRERYGDAYRHYTDVLAAAGAVNVNGRTMPLPNEAGATIYVSGFPGTLANYSRRHRRAIEEKDLREGLGLAPADGYNILLAHSPDYPQAYARWGADLSLCGHLHGGMVRLPLLGGVAGSTLKPFPKYDLGLYETEGRKMIVSAGLGAHTIPVRIFNPAQLVVIDLKSMD